MLDKLQAVYGRYEELCAKSEQPDFYNDPQKAAKLLREKNELEPVVETFLAYRRAQQDLADAQELMSDPEMRELCQQTYKEAKEEMERLQEDDETDLLEQPWVDKLLSQGELTELDRATLAQTVKEIRVFEGKRIEINYLFSEELRALLEKREGLV